MLDWPSLLVGAALSAPVNILCGFYSGLVVARWARFENLKSEVKRFILAVDYMQEGELCRYTLHKPLGELHWTTSDLLFLKHKAAAEKALTIQSEISDVSGPPHGVQITAEEAEARYSRWQRLCREMVPSWSVVLSLKPRL